MEIEYCDLLHDSVLSCATLCGCRAQQTKLRPARPAGPAPRSDDDKR